ncbi:MAG: phosphate signaling complex protein PhoU [Kangiella sp.]|jgi:phosphate transport system protein|nr:phosphate signaling complex protein PhoU [Kangiella sp.]MCW9028578.1 phosphate signaling complex protein PhoU [Kangiella sp.]
MMDNEHLGTHISKQFNADLENLREEVLAMGGIVEEQITLALDAFTNNDSSIADKVIANEKMVNAKEIKIDEACTKILAKRQPAAGDLRLIITILKTITDLERMGDEAEKIARMAKALANKEMATAHVKLHYGALLHLGNHVKQMLHDSLDAFARMDVDSAINVAKLDNQADEEYNAISRQLITYMMEEPRRISEVLDFLWSARALERIGDHANNICEYVVYLVQGEDVRHKSWDEMQRLAKDE